MSARNEKSRNLSRIMGMGALAWVCLEGIALGQANPNFPIDLNLTTSDDAMIKGVVKHLPSTAPAIGTPNPRILELDTYALNNTYGSMPLIFACERARKLTVEGLKRWYRYYPEIAVPLPRAGCYSGDHIDTLADTIDSAGTDELPSSPKDWSDADVRRVTQLEIRARTANEHFASYVSAVEDLAAKYRGVGSILKKGGSVPYIFENPELPGTFGPVSMPWYLEACNWSESEKRIKSANEWRTIFNTSFQNSGHAPFAMARSFRELGDFREAFGLAPLCTGFQHTTAIDDYFVYAPPSNRAKFVSQPLFSLAEVEQAIDWLSEEKKASAPVTALLDGKHEEIADLIRDGIGILSVDETSIGKTLAKIEAALNDLAATLEDKQGEIESITDERTDRLNAATALRREILRLQDELREHAKTIETFVATRQQSLEQAKSLGDDLRKVQALCGDALFDPCTFNNTTESGFQHIDRVLTSLNHAREEVASTTASLKNAIDTKGDLLKQVAQRTVNLRGHEAWIESFETGKISNKVEKLRQDVRNARARQRTLFSDKQVVEQSKTDVEERLKLLRNAIEQD